jgi:hypothetical protein
MKKIIITTIITTLGLLLIILLALIIIRLLGYQFNKNFISDSLNFNKQQCIEKEYPTYYNHSGIAGCVFWMREDYLGKTQSWRTLFKRDDAYCIQKYENVSKSSSGNLFSDLFSGESSDPKCEYEAFRAQKRNENWAYLVSKEKDGFYNYCVGQICPSPKMFK